MRRILVVVAMLLGLAVADIVLVSVGGAIYPGSMKWTAPVLCPDDQPDAFVIRTTETDSEGTSYSFSLFCMGERGDFSEAGSWRPLGYLFLFTYVAFIALIVLFYLLFRWRGAQKRRERGEPIERPFAPI
jgi:hypothetical protein